MRKSPDNHPTSEGGPLSPEEGLKGVKNVWVMLLLPLAAWAAALYVGVVGLPPPNDAGKPDDLTVIARIIIASFFVLWGSLAVALSRRHHLWFWRVLLIAALILTVFGWGANRWLRKDWVCNVSDKSYVIGSSGSYSDFANNYVKEAREHGRRDAIGCEELINASIGHPNNIWPQSQIDRHRLILTALFLALMPSFVLILSSASQIVICQKRPDPSAYFSGYWQDKWGKSKVPDIQLVLSIIDAKPSGTISFNFLTDIWKEKTITPKNAYFRGNTLYIKLEQPFSCVMRVSNDGHTAHLYSDKGEAKSWTLTKRSMLDKQSSP